MNERSSRTQLMDYNENFRLFMVTRNPKPELPPDASALVCEVNFTVTRFALYIKGGENVPLLSAAPRVLQDKTADGFADELGVVKLFVHAYGLWLFCCKVGRSWSHRNEAVFC